MIVVGLTEFTSDYKSDEGQNVRFTDRIAAEVLRNLCSDLLVLGNIPSVLYGDQVHRRSGRPSAIRYGTQELRIAFAAEYAAFHDVQPHLRWMSRALRLTELLESLIPFTLDQMTTMLSYVTFSNRRSRSKANPIHKYGKSGELTSRTKAPWITALIPGVLASYFAMRCCTASVLRRHLVVQRRPFRRPPCHESAPRLCLLQVRLWR